MSSDRCAGISTAARLRHRDHAADLVGELPHVARPSIEHQVFERLVGDAQHRLLQLAPELLEEVLDQRRNLFAPLAQRRDVDADHVEPVVEVFAESASATS